jgi:hypothetical protein
MEVAVLVPGIMATRLLLPDPSGGEPEEVWPPTALETQFGYNRIAKLTDPRVVAGAMIDKVLCFSFYRIIKRQLQELGYSATGTQRRLVEFPYDWRLDNLLTANKLAARLDEIPDASRITLIGHSMGGLVARLVLESGQYESRPWFSKVQRFLALATPHMGAPLALARIFGLDSTLGISKEDFRKLAANAAYPSGYQLVPAPGEHAVWDMFSPDLLPLDIYDPDTATRLGLDPLLVAEAKKMHDLLGNARKPSHVRYFYFGGAGHGTVTRVNVALVDGQPVDHTQSIVTRTPDAGDGTVPLYSALPQAGQREIVVQEHSTVFDGKPFRTVFFRLMGGDAGPAIELPGSDKAREVELSLASPILPVGRPVEAAISIVNPTTGVADKVASIEGTMIIDTVDEFGHAKVAVNVPPVKLTYAGPPIERLATYLPAIAEPGLYRLQFIGSPAKSNVAPFAVSAV